MLNDVVVIDELLLQVFRELIVGSSSVGVLGVAASAFRWELMGSQEAVASPTWVERAVYVEQRVALLASVQSRSQKSSSYLIHSSAMAVKRCH